MWPKKNPKKMLKKIQSVQSTSGKMSKLFIEYEVIATKIVKIFRKTLTVLSL